MRASPSSFASVAILVAAVAASGCSSGSTTDGPAPAGASHTVHLRGSAFAVPVTCDACHSATGFAVDFSQNPAVTAGGARFDPVTKTCSNVSCHGSFTLGTVSGTNATAAWSDPTPLGCASCHAMPPAGHPALSGAATPASCGGCHTDTVNPDGTIRLSSGAHVNGRADIVGHGCTSCHGDAARVPNLPGTDVNLVSSPPAAHTGAAAGVVGAHLGHVNPAAATALMGPVACTECHTVPADFSHATNPPARKVVFGPLATAGGATPSYTAGTLGCSATYCHGNFTFGAVSGNRTAVPLWTDGPVTCTSCHGMIPTGHPAYATTGGYTAASCAGCHPQSVNADGTIKQGGAHLNGKAEGGDCKSCHADPPSTGGHGRHSNYSCGSCHPTGYTSSVAVTPWHQNGVVDLGSQAGYLCGGRSSLVGCKPYGSVPPGYGTCTINCHEQHNNRQW